VIKSKMMSWAGHIARMEKMRNVHKMLENLKERDHLGDLGIDDIKMNIKNKV
jgi:hypothetical protein